MQLKMPSAKDHRSGKYDVVVAVRMGDGSEVAYTSTSSLDADHPIVRHARESLAAAFGVDARNVR